ncbi:3-beta hydroxysteroid dehydrogenase/isomerase, partial [Infundibulicybe gibba]
IHTASPVHGLPPDIVYYKVNENGTRVIISACQKAGIKKLVYTSSTGVVWTGEEFNGITEDEAKIPAKGFDAYHHTKALGERLILKENGVNGMRTVALRPCGMTGEGDKQLIWRFAKVLKDGRQNVQIGNNTNLVDYLYAGNAAYAHVLAADRLYDKPDLVAGQAFFITNGSPVPQWNFMRMAWKELGDDGKKSIVKIPRIVGVRFATGTQWYSIEKV